MQLSQDISATKTFFAITIELLNIGDIFGISCHYTLHIPQTTVAIVDAVPVS